MVRCSGGRAAARERPRSSRRASSPVRLHPGPGLVSTAAATTTLPPGPVDLATGPGVDSLFEKKLTKEEKKAAQEKKKAERAAKKAAKGGDAAEEEKSDE